MVTAGASDGAEPVFHIALPEHWAHAQATGRYTMSRRHQTFDEVGFVHLSFGHQVAGTANLLYADLPEVVLLEIDVAGCGGRLVVERGSGAGTDDVAEPGSAAPVAPADETFPHLYMPLTLDAVVAAHRWRRGVDGAYASTGTPPEA